MGWGQVEGRPRAVEPAWDSSSARRDPIRCFLLRPPLRCPCCPVDGRASAATRKGSKIRLCFRGTCPIPSQKGLLKAACTGRGGRDCPTARAGGQHKSKEARRAHPHVTPSSQALPRARRCQQGRSRICQGWAPVQWPEAASGSRQHLAQFRPGSVLPWPFPSQAPGPSQARATSPGEPVPPSRGASVSLRTRPQAATALGPVPTLASRHAGPRTAASRQPSWPGAPCGRRARSQAGSPPIPPGPRPPGTRPRPLLAWVTHGYLPRRGSANPFASGFTWRGKWPLSLNSRVSPLSQRLKLASQEVSRNRSRCLAKRWSRPDASPPRVCCVSAHEGDATSMICCAVCSPRPPLLALCVRVCVCVCVCVCVLIASPQEDTSPAGSGPTLMTSL